MTVVTQGTKRSGYYLMESAAPSIVNEEIIIASGAGVLDPGTVLGQLVDLGGTLSFTPTAKAGNTGNGAMGAVTGDAGADVGTWRLTIIEPGANAGTFRLEKPDGTEDGTGTVGVAYNGTLNFTLADGATDFVAGDGFSIAVSASAPGKYVLHDEAGNDGREVAAGILFHRVDATSVDVKTVATRNGPASINGNCLTFKSGISAAGKAAALTALRERGLKVLPQHAS